MCSVWPNCGVKACHQNHRRFFVPFKLFVFTTAFIELSVYRLSLGSPTPLQHLQSVENRNFTSNDIPISINPKDGVDHYFSTKNNESVSLWCLERGDGLYPSGSNCSEFTRCFNGKRTALRCPPNLYFNTELKACAISCKVDGQQAGSRLGASSLLGQHQEKFDSENDLRELLKSKDDAYCRHRADGVHANFTSGCRSYFGCNSGVVSFKEDCIHSDVFDWKLGKCISKADCTVSCPRIDCSNAQQDVLFGLPGTDGVGYYECKDGHALERRCGDEKDARFSYVAQKCVAVEADDLQSDTDGNACGQCQSISLMPDASHGCVRLFVCNAGKVDRITHCPSDHSATVFGCVLIQDISEFVKEQAGTCTPAPRNNLAVFDDQIATPNENLISFVQKDEQVGPSDSRSGSFCLGKTEGFYADETARCTTYFFCKNGLILFRGTCPEGQLFDGSSCTDKENYRSLNGPCMANRVTVRGKITNGTTGDCHSKSDGPYPDLTTGCQRYFFCTNERRISSRNCPDGTLFNGVMCLPSQLVSCEQRALVKDRCYNVEEDGFHTVFESGCKDFVYCFNKKEILRDSCDDNLVFDGKECISKEQFLCSGPREQKECAGRPQGTIRDASSCSRFHYCSAGVQWDLKCQDGKIFDGSRCSSSKSKISECIKSQRTEANSCEGKPSGSYYVEQGSSCQSYYFCSKGFKTTYLCTEGSVFDGNRCRPADEYRCPDADKSKKCTNLIDGYHFDAETSCHNYFFCQSGIKLNTLSCPAGKLFNGRRCVEKSEFSCPIGNQTKGSLLGRYSSDNPCFQKLDGFHPDHRRPCGSYVVCHKETVIRESICPNLREFKNGKCSSTFCGGEHVSINSNDDTART